MPEPTELNDDEDRDDLVAYLDGERDEPAARAVEAKLNVDAAAREDADTLRRTWDLLDYLPRAEPSPSFTHRTMERLEPVVRTTMIRVRPWKRWRPLALGMGWAAAVLVAGAGGFYAMNLYQARSHRHQEQELVHDLRIIENKRLYEAVDDLEFLRELDHPDLFGDDSSGS